MNYLRILALYLFSAMLYSSSAFAEPSRPFPQHVSYAPGTIYPSAFSQAEQDQHVRDFYDHWKARYLVSAGIDAEGTDLFRVSLSYGSSATVSEGQGYGMVIVALMAGHDPDAQRLFDGLWRFSRQYPSGIDSRLMSWKIDNGSIVEGNDSAFDGDMDMAYALLLAQAQWGDSSEINYQAEANQLIEAILSSTIGSNSYLPKLGDWVEDDGWKYNEYSSRSSDFMLAYFHTFARVTQDTRWDTVALNSQAVIDSIQSNYSTVTGLLPDFIRDCQQIASCRPSGSRFLEGAHDGRYYYNAGRTPWRLGLDALLNNDAVSKVQVLKMIDWLSINTENNVNNIKEGYRLNGVGIGDYSTSFFIAPFAVAAMLGSSHQAFLNNLYVYIYNKHEDYYADSINLLSLLVLSANYWDPVTGDVPAAACEDGLDNDQDGLIDYPEDPGCASAADDSELGVLATPSLTVEVQITRDWEYKYCAKVFVRNRGTEQVDSWMVLFEVDGQINKIWDASYIQTGQDVIAEGLAKNSVIKAGKRRTFRFCALR